MKKLTSFIVIATIVFASCESKKEATTAPEAPKGTGYTLDSSANIDMVKKLNIAFPSGDSATAYACYNDTAKVHDNLQTMSVKDNFHEFQSLVQQGQQDLPLGYPFDCEHCPQELAGDSQYGERRRHGRRQPQCRQEPAVHQ